MEAGGGSKGGKGTTSLVVGVPASLDPEGGGSSSGRRRLGDWAMTAVGWITRQMEGQDATCSLLWVLAVASLVACLGFAKAYVEERGSLVLDPTDLPKFFKAQAGEFVPGFRTASSPTEEAPAIKAAEAPAPAPLPPAPAPRSPPAMLSLYELYYNKAAYDHLHRSDPYRPLSVYPGMARANTSDIDGPALLPLLRDSAYQGLLCEYGGIFAVANHLAALQGPVPWVGFTSWRASQKGSAIPEGVMSKWTENMRANLEGGGSGEEGEGEGEEEGEPPPKTGDPAAGTAGTHLMYYWAAWGPTEMYGNCDSWHDRCSLVYAATFERLFGSSDGNGSRAAFAAAVDPTAGLELKDEFLPPLPTYPNFVWSLMSYWALHVDRFREYVRFARMFVVTMESIWDLHADVDKCPLVFRNLPYTNRLCWCFILERLINIWAYHTGMHMMFGRVENGDLITQFPLEQRPTVWSHWFSKENMEKVLKEFPSRLPPKSLELYQQLGGAV